MLLELSTEDVEHGRRRRRRPWGARATAGGSPRAASRKAAPRSARMAATRRGGRPEPRYVAAVRPARPIGTTNSSARPTPASRPSHAAAGRRHFQRRFPGVADGRPGQQADDDEAAAERSRRRCHGADWRTSRIGKANATTPAARTAATTEAGAVDRPWNSSRHGQTGSSCSVMTGPAPLSARPRRRRATAARRIGSPAAPRTSGTAASASSASAADRPAPAAAPQSSRSGAGRAGRRSDRAGSAAAPNPARAPSRSPRPAGGPAAIRPARR